MPTQIAKLSHVTLPISFCSQFPFYDTNILDESYMNCQYEQYDNMNKMTKSENRKTDQTYDIAYSLMDI